MSIAITILLFIGFGLLVYAQAEANRVASPAEYKCLPLEFAGVACLLGAAIAAALWGLASIFFS